MFSCMLPGTLALLIGKFIVDSITNVQNFEHSGFALNSELKESTLVPRA